MAPHHHGADARIGKNFQQQGVGHPAIDDVGRRHPLGQGPDAALGLRSHAAFHHAIVDQLACIRQGQLTN